MMKNITLTMLAVATSVAAFAQTPITISSIPALTGPYQANLSINSSGGVPNPTVGANQFWNYADITWQDAELQDFGATMAGPVPGVNMIRSNVFTELVPSYGYNHSILMGLTSNHLASFGHDLLHQVYSMGPVTGNANDSITIPAQTAVFSSPAEHLKFPLTYNAGWMSDYNYELNALVDVTLMGMNNAPMTKRMQVFSLDSISGWGTMVVPSTGGPSQPYEVLALKHTEIRIDSFFLNGSPADPALLAALSQTQGQISMSNSYRFYRQGTFVPLIQFDYGDNNFTQPTKVTYDRNTQTAISAPESLEGKAQLYPNPSAGNLSIGVAAAGNYNFTLTDLAGRQVYAAKANFDGSAAQVIAVPASVANGLYVWQLSSENGKYIGSGKVSVQR